ncbi:MAG: class I SAM-dependent methyltransferase [Candidatus Marinimicrobia bacterium]|nr:class I SAM-dependent methyltransferase [Candidatus Neomarinimicrobiota bacterium]
MSDVNNDRDHYDNQIAGHYASYRPPLHQKILTLALPKNRSFEAGLDIGSGTGYSAIALAEHCESVIGIEPSDSMREKATSHDKVTYLSGSGETIPLDDACMDIVTFAGALFYMDRSRLIPELQRVCRPGGYIVVYDFEVILQPVLRSLSVVLDQPDDQYDHAANLSGTELFIEITVCRDQLQLPVTPTELCHILLATPESYSVLADKYGQDKLFDKLVGRVEEKENLGSVSVDIYYSSYQLSS